MRMKTLREETDSKKEKETDKENRNEEEEEEEEVATGTTITTKSDSPMQLTTLLCKQIINLCAKKRSGHTNNCT